MDLDEYLNALASERPAPGGGSAAALTGALGAALLAMVSKITGSNRRFAERAADAAALAERADALRAELSQARLDDERAFEAVVTAQALPRATQPEKDERSARLAQALRGASETPLHTARAALEALRECRAVLALGNSHLASDVGCAAEFAAAAVAAAAYNVRANHPYMKDEALVRGQRDELAVIERERDALLAEIRAAFAENASA